MTPRRYLYGKGQRIGLEFAFDDPADCLGACHYIDHLIGGQVCKALNTAQGDDEDVCSDDDSFGETPHPEVDITRSTLSRKRDQRTATTSEVERKGRPVLVGFGLVWLGLVWLGLDGLDG